MSDADCGAGLVCDVGPCGLACIPSCKPAGCPTGEVCGANLHCQPQPCDVVEIRCPPYFICAPGQPGAQCLRQSCSSDPDCTGGFCVDGACYGALGMCTYPPP
jgi:hypothetical protein